MDFFSQKMFFIRAIFFLVILNLITVGFLLWKSLYSHEPLLFPKNETYKNITGVLQKELKLNDYQVNKLNQIREHYYFKEIILKRKIKNFKDEMNIEMFNSSSDDAKIISLAKQIADGEYQMELLRYKQAKELKSICTSAQQEKMESLVKEIRDYFRPDNQPTKR